MPLDAEQSLRWQGPWPAEPPLDLMSHLQWRAIERLSPGVRCRETADRVSVDLFGRVPLLVLAHERDVVEPALYERRWRVVGGLTAKRPPPDAWTSGSFALGLSPERAWVRVEAYPSRLADLPLVGRLYGLFHAQVSHAYLRALRRQLAR